MKKGILFGVLGTLGVLVLCFLIFKMTMVKVPTMTIEQLDQKINTLASVSVCWKQVFDGTATTTQTLPCILMFK